MAFFLQGAGWQNTVKVSVLVWEASYWMVRLSCWLRDTCQEGDTDKKDLTMVRNTSRPWPGEICSPPSGSTVSDKWEPQKYNINQPDKNNITNPPKIKLPL